MAGGGGDDDKPAATRTQALFLFNVILGTGLFALPRLFATAGVVYASLFLFVVAFFSYLGITWLIESLAVTSVVTGAATPSAVGVRDGTDDSLSSGMHLGGAAHATGSHGVWGKYKQMPWARQNGMMTFVLFSRVGQVLWFGTLVIYLYGDLSVYTVFVPRTLSQVFPSLEVFGHTLDTEAVYLWGLGLFSVIFVPFVFGNFQKTLVLQIVTGVQRHVVFWTIIVWSLSLILGHKVPADAPAVTQFDPSAGTPLLFGDAVYALICQQYIASIVAPMRNKQEAPKMVRMVIMAILFYYMLLCWSASFAVPQRIKVCDLITFDFKDLQPQWLAKLLLSVPLLGVCTNFPLIAITLRDNLVILYQLAVGEGGDPRSRDASYRELSQPILGEGDKPAPHAQGGLYSTDNTSYSSAQTPLRISHGLLAQNSDTSMGSEFGGSDFSVPSTMVRGAVGSPLRQRIALGLVTCIPPIAVAITRAEVSTVIAITGSYGGCAIMFVFPGLFVLAARDTLRRRGDLPRNRDNPHASPFQATAWVVLVWLFAATALVIVTVHMIQVGPAGHVHDHGEQKC